MRRYFNFLLCFLGIKIERSLLINMALSDEQKRFVENNLRLVHYLVNHKCGKSQNDEEYDDMVSIGEIGLIKASKTYDSSKEIKFATYATRCILNEIFMYFRKSNKYANDISLDEPIESNHDGRELTKADIIEDTNANFVEKDMIKEDFIHLVSITLNCLNIREKLLILYQMGNLTQREMAEKLNISQSYVSRLLSKTILRVRYLIDHKVPYNKVFSVDAIGDKYVISFSVNDIIKLDKISATFLQELESIQELTEFKVTRNKERISIQIFAEPEAFVFIAKLIQEIEQPIMVCQDTKLTSIETNTDVEKDNVLISKKVNKATEIRNYILSRECFNIREIRQHFPNFSIDNIHNVVYYAKKKGLIKCIARGKYVVNKD